MRIDRSEPVRFCLSKNAVERSLSIEIRRRSLSRVLVVTPTVGREPDLWCAVERAVPETASVVRMIFPQSESPEADLAGAIEFALIEETDAVIALGDAAHIEFARLVASGLAEANQPYFVAIPSDIETLRILSAKMFEPNRDSGSASFHVGPNLVIWEAKNIVSFDSTITAARVAMSVLADGIEVYCARGTNPVADALALNAVRRASFCLERLALGEKAVDFEAALTCAAAECLVAGHKGMGAARAMANAMTVICRTARHRGELSAVLLPLAIEYNRSSPVARERLAKIIEVPPLHAATHVRELAAALQLPKTLRDLGTGAKDIDNIAFLAYRDRCTRTNPRQIREQDYSLLVQAACGIQAGDLS